ncbi:transglycosylase domain-containing protein [Marinitenerispora sediminis]|uniref:transglycosylase domain-containing protein n=1 Tax=Marinitenerispora sediminis TaxID=1931232 RepID=UPI002161112A|nr:transglycosylase domain-containing protein [Marinitenerispora sediminis]
MDSKQPDPKDSAGDGTGDRPSAPESTGNDDVTPGHDGPDAATSGADETGSDTGAERRTADDAPEGSADAVADEARGPGASGDEEFSWFSGGSASDRADASDTGGDAATGSADPGSAADSATAEAGTAAEAADDSDAGAAEESPYLAASAFDDSGSFFRDKVAQSLAEQYGLDLAPDGTIRETEERAAAADPAEPEDGDGAAHPAAEGPDRAEPAERAAAGPAAGAAPDPGWDPEGTAQFTPVFDDDDDDDAPVRGTTGDRAAGSAEERTEESSASAPGDQPGTPAAEADSGPADAGAAAGAVAAAGPGWDPEGTAEFTPVFDDDDDGDDEHGAANADGRPAPAAGGDGAPESQRPAFEPAPTAPVPADAATAAAAATAATAALGAGAAAAADEADDSTAATASAAGPGGTPKKTKSRKSGKPGKPGKAAAAAGSGPGKGKPKKKRPLWWRLTRGGLIAAGVCLVLGLAGFGVAYAMIPVPEDAQEQATDQGSTFYYADGETVFAERGVNRDPVGLEEIPRDVQNAILSAEDRGFWTEPGVSVRGTFRAGWSTLTGQQLQGGSTVTQQMVRNYYEGLSQEQTISRKLKEIIISIKVDRSQSKEWILEQYLNTIYFGRNAYGIQAAAQAYYHKDVGDLTPAEAAFLAAAIQQPTKFGLADSETTPEMEQRWQYVVDGLVTMESITPAQAAEYEFPKPETEVPQEGIDLSGYKGYMLQQAMAELERLGYTEDNINRGGYQIITTFDQHLMDAAKEAVESNVPVDQLPEGVQAGLTAIDPATGEVVAFYGGADYNENQYDSAFRGSAQAGSAFKPYVLAAALENGYSLNTVVDGSSPQVFNGSEVRNSGGGAGGAMNLIEATRVSNNTGYINLALQVGLDNVVETAHAAGIPDNKITDEQASAPTLALGVSDVSPVDQASGYATFANGGEHIEAHVVRSVINREGEDEREPVATEQVISEGAAADVTYALRQVVAGGTGTGANLPDGRPVAGKTGTTDSSVAAWFAGYTPQLSTAVGIYNGNNQPFSVPGYGQLSGGSLPTTVWRSFMATAMEGEEVQSFPEPTFGGATENFAPNVPAPGQGTDQNTAPQQPEAPVESEPVDPGPVDPVPVDPGPGTPVDPGPGDPGPGDPGPVDPPPADPETGDPPATG